MIVAGLGIILSWIVANRQSREKQNTSGSLGKPKRIFLRIFSLLHQWIINNWQLIIGLLITLAATYGAFIFTQSLWSIGFTMGLVLISFWLTRLYYLNFPNNPSLITTDTAKQKSSVQSSLKTPRPELPRKTIKEWESPLPGFETIPFDKKMPDGQGITNCLTHTNISIKFKKPLFGLEGIPFELKKPTSGNGIRCIECRPRSPKDGERREILGADNVEAAYALIAAAKAYRIVGNVKFNKMRIGYLEFYFEEGEPHKEELVLGKNIRDSSFKHPDLVGEITSSTVEEVWRFEDDKNQTTIDMLHVNFDPPRNIKHCKVFAQFDPEKISESYKGNIFPSIRLLGLTYRLSSE